MKRYESATRTKFWQRLWLPVLVGMTILTMTLWLWQGLLFQEQVHIRANVKLAAETACQEITTQIQTRILALTRMGQRWELQDGTAKQEWVADASNYYQDYPGFQALQWVDESYRVRWIVPFAGNEPAQNIDAASDIYRQTALDTAKKSGKATMTPTVALTQGGEGFLVYIPLFLRSSQFNGSIVGIFQTQSLLEGILDKDLKRQYAITVFDGSKQIYSTETGYLKAYQPLQLTHHTEINLTDVTWWMQVSATLAVLTQQHSPLPNVILAGGLVTAVMIGWVVCLIQRTRLYAQEVEEKNQDLCHEIAERRKTERALETQTAILQNQAQLLDLSEKRFRGAFEHTAVGMALVSPEGNWLQVNQAFCQMVGYSQEELLDTNFQSITHPHDLQTDLDYLRKLLADEISSCDFEKRYIHKLGHPIWILLSVSVARDINDNILYFVCQIQNITARKQVEAELRWQETLLRSMANASPLAFYVVDERTNDILYLNHQFCEIWDIECWEEQMQQGEVKLDGQFTSFSGSCDSQPNSQAIPKVVIEACKGLLPIDGNRLVQEDEISYNGRVIRRFSTQIRDHQDVYFGRLYIFEDISDRREIERLKDEFVSVVSHELRTPLTSIRGSLGLVANGVLQSQPQKAQRMLQIAVNNSDRLIRLINDILDIERIESGKVQMTKEVCDAASLMNQSVDVMRALAEKAEVDLSVTPLSAYLWADPDRIIQTLTNLLSNAIKFSEPGTTVSLTAQVKTSEHQIIFQVKDTGRGIPADKLEAVFGRFQQVDASDSRKKGGTGLGLAICRSIIQHHDGHIWVESVFGEGSTFYVSLPLLQEQVPLSGESSRQLVLAGNNDLSV